MRADEPAEMTPSKITVTGDPNGRFTVQRTEEGIQVSIDDGIPVMIPMWRWEYVRRVTDGAEEAGGIVVHG